MQAYGAWQKKLSPETDTIGATLWGKAEKSAFLFFLSMTIKNYLHGAQIRIDFYPDKGLSFIDTRGIKQMATFAILTVGYNEFLLPAKDAQLAFEMLSGRACDVNWITTDDAATAGTTRGDTIRNAETRVQCRLMTTDDMHAALDRARAIDAKKEADRVAYLSTDAA
jgi:hypothetical protein